MDWQRKVEVVILKRSFRTGGHSRSVSAAVDDWSLAFDALVEAIFASLDPPARGQLGPFYASISTSMNPCSLSMLSRSVRSGCGASNQVRSNSPNFGTSEVLTPFFLKAAA